MITDKFVTVSEAANALEIDASLVSRYCREGRLAAERFGRQWFIPKGTLTQFRKQPRQRGNPNFGKKDEQ